MAIEERVAVLETKMDTIEAQLEQIKEKQDTLLQNFTKYKGFVGGILFTISAIGTAIGMAISYWTGRG